ncbi:MAG: 3-hydroxyacyl-ACP dehydratase FabZ [Holosporales bacterium]|jgi:3-hydroxyacyl-[acyl-carrier-protein] dehydratase|nr:3-hydroxyacyl-ACP dehydratase FabZ [Holosporales bacterium]
MNKKVLHIEDIKKIIPHRYPFILIDKIVDIEPGVSCTAHKNVSCNEWFFKGHFPNNPVMPGVLIIEAIAQAACVLALYETSINSDVVYFASIDSAKFKKPVLPGDVLQIKVNVLQKRGNKFWKFHGEAYVEEALTDIAEFTAMIP